MQRLPDRIPLAITPTPLEFLPALTEAWGGPEIWVKRDDLTGFELSGNKIRKLEFHLAAAFQAGADTVVTCGAIQSNHCRATALACARLGLACRLLLRTPDGHPPSGPPTGNHLLHRLSGASIRFITPDDYDRRDEVMAEEAERVAAGGGTAWVIPEGASDALGMWGFVAATMELADQLAAIRGPVAAVWHPASSGGTTAGIGWAADRLRLEVPIVGASIGDPAPEVAAAVAAIWEEAAEQTGGSIPTPDWEIIDRHAGGGYGVVSNVELAAQTRATAATGLLFDPTYTGKALAGLEAEVAAGTYRPGERVVYWHTGGGFAVFAHDYTEVLP